MSHLPFSGCSAGTRDPDDVAYCDRALRHAVRECKKLNGKEYDCHYNIYLGMLESRIQSKTKH